MARGRKKTPVQLKLAAGTYRPDRDGPIPSAPSGPMPDPPGFLDADARADWLRLAPALHAVGLLAPTDADALAILCVTLATWRRAVGRLREYGEVVETERGTRRNPAAAVADQAAALLLRLFAELGMTPSSRARLRIEPARPPDAFEALCAKHGRLTGLDRFAPERPKGNRASPTKGV